MRHAHRVPSDVIDSKTVLSISVFNVSAFLHYPLTFLHGLFPAVHTAFPRGLLFRTYSAANTNLMVWALDVGSN